VSSTDVLLNIATAAQLFHASASTGFADLIIDGHRETWPLRGKRFQAWLRQQYYERIAPGMRQARPRSTQPSMCWKREPRSMVRSTRSRSGSPSRTA
jgi:hypothetical protein